MRCNCDQSPMYIAKVQHGLEAVYTLILFFNLYVSLDKIHTFASQNNLVFWFWVAGCILCYKGRIWKKGMFGFCNEKFNKLNSSHEDMRIWVCWRDTEKKYPLALELKICITGEIEVLLLSSEKPVPQRNQKVKMKFCMQASVLKSMIWSKYFHVYCKWLICKWQQ